MRPEKEILDPYQEPDDLALAELAKVRNVKPGTGGRIMMAAFVVALALGVGFAFVRFQRTQADTLLAATTRQDASEPPTVNVVRVQRAEALQNLTLPGETAAWDTSTIYARVNGYVSRWNVDIGDLVKAGQLLATIDTPELDAELAAAKAKLNAVVAEVGVRQAQLDFAQTTEQRWRDSPKGVVSDQERESKAADKAEAVANLAAAKAQVALQQAEVDRLDILTQFKDVKSPYDGTIIQRHIEIGDLVSAGSTVNTSSLYRISRDYPMRVFAHVPQSAAPRLIDGGADAEITSSDVAGLHVAGHVTRTAKSLNPASRTMRVEIDIAKPVPGLAPGMYVQVKFKLTGAPAYQVPAAAMLFRTGGPQVAVVDDKGIITFRDVTIGADEGSVVSIVSGLEDGDRVALNLSSQIVSGARVKAQEMPETVAVTAR